MPRVAIRTIRREYILDVAERVMAEQGWVGTTFNAICQSADISNGMLTYHFKDKDDLLFALFERSMAKRRARSQEIMGDVSRPLGQRITALIQHHVRQRDAEMREFCLLAHHFLSLGTERPEMGTRLDAILRLSVETMQTALRQEADRGGLRCDPGHAAVMIVSVLKGLALMPDTPGLAPSIDAVTAMLLTYLTVDDGAATAGVKSAGRLA